MERKKKTCTSSASIGLHYGIKKCLFTLESKCVCTFVGGNWQKRRFRAKIIQKEYFEAMSMILLKIESLHKFHC